MRVFLTHDAYFYPGWDIDDIKEFLNKGVFNISKRKRDWKSDFRIQIT